MVKVPKILEFVCNFGDMSEISKCILQSLSCFLSHPLGGVVEHLLPGWVKLPAVLLQKSLLGQSDGFFGCSQDLYGSLEFLCGSLSFHLSLLETHKKRHMSEPVFTHALISGLACKGMWLECPLSLHPLLCTACKIHAESLRSCKNQPCLFTAVKRCSCFCSLWLL